MKCTAKKYPPQINMNYPEFAECIHVKGHEGSHSGYNFFGRIYWTDESVYFSPTPVNIVDYARFNEPSLRYATGGIITYPAYTPVRKPFLLRMKMKFHNFKSKFGQARREQEFWREMQ